MEAKGSAKVIKVGSRKSQLALIQTNHVIDALKKLFPDKEFEIVTMHTLGDKILDKPLPKIGEKSLFTKELEQALEDGSVDFVVHSLKDLPTTLPEKLAVGAICQREDARDAVVIHPALKSKSLAELPKGSVVGTSSLRRVAQLSERYPDLEVRSIRGNLNTRLSKLENSVVEPPEDGGNWERGYSALILAVAGVERMGWKDKISQVLESHELMYAVGQGALAVECRSDDADIENLLAPLHHRATVLRVVAERSLLKRLGGGCSAPVAVDCHFNESNEVLCLEAGVWSLDGKKCLLKKGETTIKTDEEEPPKKMAKKEVLLFAGIMPTKLDAKELSKAQELGIKIAEELIEDGGLEIMKEARLENEKPEAKALVAEHVREAEANGKNVETVGSS